MTKLTKYQEGYRPETIGDATEYLQTSLHDQILAEDSASHAEVLARELREAAEQARRRALDARRFLEALLVGQKVT